MLRCAQHDTAVLSMTGLSFPATRWQGERVPPGVPRAAAPECHPERSEGSVAMGTEMLRCAQHDRAALRMIGLSFPATLRLWLMRIGVPLRSPSEWRPATTFHFPTIRRFLLLYGLLSS